MKTYTVYRLENVVTKKNYIGMTSLNPQIRWGSGYTGKMKEAIDAFPLDLCWKKSIEFQTPNKEQALELEAELMKWYDSVENGYNSSTYSSYGFTEETKRKMSKAHTGEKNHMYGKHPSEESKKKMAEAKGVNGILQFSKTGEFIAEYYSLNEASRQTGCHNQSICACCKGKRKTAGGYIWKYKQNTN